MFLQYCCYIEECKEKFKTSEDRWDHCVIEHKLPKDFKFDQKSKPSKKNKPQKTVKNQKLKNIEGVLKPNDKTDSENIESMQKKFSFNNCKHKTFKYTGKKFTNTESNTKNINIDVVMAELKENLPE